MATRDSMEQAMLEMAESPMEDVVNGGDLEESKHAPQIAPGGTEATDLTNGAATDGLEEARTRRNRRDRAKGKGKEVIRPLEISNTRGHRQPMRQNIAALTQPGGGWFTGYFDLLVCLRFLYELQSEGKCQYMASGRHEVAEVASCRRQTKAG